jgi:hypothetical protein
MTTNNCFGLPVIKEVNARELSTCSGEFAWIYATVLELEIF